jgi:hypothetical protein
VKEKKMMKSKGVLGIVAVLILGFTVMGCTTFAASGIEYGRSNAGVEVLGNFSTRVYMSKFLGTSGGNNLFNLSSDATDGRLRSAIDREIRRMGGTAAINISVRWGSNPLQWILNNLTFKIWAPGTLVIRGTVIRESGVSAGGSPGIIIQNNMQGNFQNNN